METTLNKIIELIEDRSSFSCDDKTDNYLLFSTRANGSVYDEEYSPIDVAEARKVIDLIKSRYPKLDLSYEIDTCDEWVNINIEPTKKTVPVYTFIKHFGGEYTPLQRGYSKSFYSLEELEKECGLPDVDLINFNYGEIPQNQKAFYQYTKVVRVVDGGKEDYSYSIGFSFEEKTKKFEDIFGSHE